MYWKYTLVYICLVYLDDILIFKILNKCKLFSKGTEFLFNIVTSDGTKPNPEKLKAIEIKSFLGLTAYLKRGTKVNIFDKDWKSKSIA